MLSCTFWLYINSSGAETHIFCENLVNIMPLLMPCWQQQPWYRIYKKNSWALIQYKYVPLSRILSANQYELAFVAHRTSPYWFELLRISSLPLSYYFAGQYECFEMFKTFVLALRIEASSIASYCIAERRTDSCQFLLVCISSLYIRIDSLYIRTGIRRLSAATQYVAIRCATIALSYWIPHVSIGSFKFLLVPIVFSSHQSAIVLNLHHHRTASYCIMSPSCCILLHLIASYQFMFNSCLIRIDSQIIIVSNRSGSA